MDLSVLYKHLSGSPTVQEFNGLFKKYILLIMLLQLSQFLPLYPPPPSTPIPSSNRLLSSCPWATHLSSLASPFPILFLTSPVYFVPANLYLIPVPFPPFSPLPLPADNFPCDLHFCDSAHVLVVCLVLFCFVFRFSC